jgi:hypothetical protein
MACLTGRAASSGGARSSVPITSGSNRA